MRKLTEFLLAFCLASSLSGCGQSYSEKLTADSFSDGLWQYSEIEGVPYQTQLSGRNRYTVSFWIRPENNYPDTALLFLGSENQYIAVTGSGYHDGVFSGLSLISYDGGKTDAVSAGDSAVTVSCRRWNHIQLSVRNGQAEVFLNGVSALKGAVCRISDAAVSVGSAPAGMKEVRGRISGLTVNSEVLGEKEAFEAYQALYPAVLLDTIDYSDSEHLDHNIWLPGSKIDGVDVNWTVEENPVMDARGILRETDTACDVHAAASVSTAYASASKEFVFHIEGSSAQENLQKDLRCLDADIEGVIFSGTKLPLREIHGSKVVYEVSEGPAAVREGVLIKTSDEARPVIRLKAVLENGGFSAEREYSTVLLDAAAGYVMSYFNGDPGSETGYLAVSQNGLDWIKLEGSDITASAGTKRVRDPNLARTKDGGFVITATQGMDNPEIYVMTSEDLTSFTEAEPVLVGVADPGMKMSGTRAWAPEVIYDNENDLYTVYFSDPGDECAPMYYVTTSDFETYSYPDRLFDPGYPVIDGTIFVMDGRYWMIYKDERAAVQTIFSAVSSCPGERFEMAYDMNILAPLRKVEGPMVFRDIETNGYRIFIDDFSHHTFLAGRFSRLGDKPDPDWSDTERLSLPEDDVRHGSVVRITEKEYEALCGYYMK